MIKRRGSILGRKRGPLVQEDTPATPFTISTPYRLLRTPLADIGETPFAIKFPLLAFINAEYGGSVDLEIKMKAQKIVSHAAQQSIIAKVGALRELCLFTSKRHITLVSELKRQYIIALLDDSDDAHAIIGTIKHLAKTEALSDAEPAPSAIIDQITTEAPVSALVACSSEPLAVASLEGPASTEQPTEESSVRASSPIKTTPNRTTPIGQTPLNVMKRHHVNRLRIQAMTQKIAEEPEYVKVAVRKRLSSIIEEPDEERSLTNAMSNVVYSAKRAQPIAQTPSKKMRYLDSQVVSISPSCDFTNQIPPSSTRGPPLSVTVAIGATPEIEGLSEDTMFADTHTAEHAPLKSNLDKSSREYDGVLSLLNRPSRSTVFESITEEEEDSMESPTSSIHSDHATMKENKQPVRTSHDYTRPTTAASARSPPRHSTGDGKSLDDIKINRRSSVASMFTSRAAPQKGNKFQSRVSLTSKMRRTREKRQMRSKQSQNADAENVENVELVKQAGPRLRKLERFAAIAESKFTAFKDTDCLEPLKEVLANGRRLEIAQYCQTISDPSLYWPHLLEYFYGHRQFRPHQFESLEYLSRYDQGALLLCLPTGAGKSMVFTLAAAHSALVDNGVSVMILPTKALVADQYESALRNLGGSLTIVKLHSGMEIIDYARVFKGLAAGLVDILLTTPEQFISMTVINILKHAPRQLSLVCVDEAHCLSEWSHTFRPAYQSVIAISDYYHPAAKLLLMTATITQETEDSITKMTREVPDDRARVKVLRVKDGHWRPDLMMHVKHFNEPSMGALENAISYEQKKWENSTHLVFVWMKYQAEQLARQLKERGFGESVYFYHSDVSESEKQQLAELLTKGAVDILVSTQALGVGLDISHITNVYHLSHPGSVEQWLQEVGRCNRDKRADLATCYGFGVFKEYWNHRQKTAGSVIDTVALSQFLAQVMSPSDAGGQEVNTAKEMRYRLSSKAHKLSVVRWKSDTHSLITMDLEAVKKFLNCWTEDEIYVISAIIERYILEEKLNGVDKLGWWILSDLELRCFDRDLDELGETGGVITALRESCWKDRANQGVYKLRWSEILMDPEIRDPLDIRDKIYSICHENKISVRTAPGSRRLYVLKQQLDMSASGAVILTQIRDQMLRNNEAQLRKQEVVRLAWKIAEEGDQDQLKEFLRMYFNNTLPWPIQDQRHREWLYEGVQFLDDTGARAVFRNDVELLRECLATLGASSTPLACARILCGLQKAETTTQAWRGRYANVPFEIVHRLAR